MLIAGLTPTLAAWLVETTQNLMMPAYYLMVIAVVGMATGLSMKETANRPLKGRPRRRRISVKRKKSLASTTITSSKKSKISIRRSPICRQNGRVWCSSIRVSTTNRFHC
nr:Proline porter II [Klebsiella pneumoniae]